ncbi:MAG TPA: hypothetical protein PKX92_02750 [Edaphocola sp.]|nr:hypothetical protein [Edaphocola sp.]
MKKRHNILLLNLGLAITIFSSCSSTKGLPSANALTQSNCFNKTDYSYTLKDLPNKLISSKVDPLLSSKFSFEALNVANAIGIIQPLKEYILSKEKYKINPSVENRLDILEQRVTIVEKINASSLEISSVTSELDCEKKRVDQIANYLKAKADRRETNLVIGSTIVGAVGAIMTEGLNNSPNTGQSGSYVAVGSAMVETTLGILMLIDRKSVLFLHERNTIGEIWNNVPVSKTLPPSIWYYLNYEDSLDKKHSLRELLVEHWEVFGQVKKREEMDNGTTEIYFGKGGKYSSDELKTRAEMFGQIEVYIRLMKQDLEILSTELKNM